MASTIAEVTRRIGDPSYLIYQTSARRYAVGEVYPEDIRHFIVESPHGAAITLGTDHGLPVYRMRPVTKPVIHWMAFWYYGLCMTGRASEIPEADRLGRWPS